MTELAGANAARSVELRRGEIALAAAIYRPDAEGRSPAVIVAPGGLARGDLEAYRWAGERLAASGYLALVITYRAPAPYDDANDIALAIDWLDHDERVDSGRLAVLGHSRGGLAALLAAASDARLKAIVSIAAPVDIEEYVRSLAAFAPAARVGIVQFMGGEPDQLRERYASVRALSLAGHVRQPVLLIQGAADMRVPLENSQRLEAALRESGNDRVRLELIPGMGHFLELGTVGYQFDRVTQLVTSWLGEVL